MTEYEEIKLARLRALLAVGEAQIARGESTTIRRNGTDTDNGYFAHLT